MRALAIFSCALALAALASSACNQNDRGMTMTAMCPNRCQSCDATTGTCKDCTPGQDFCQDNELLMSCNADGTVGDLVRRCDLSAGETCGNQKCITRCDAAAESHSYIGCDYWPTTTLTSALDPVFDFAVVVANPATTGDGTVVGEPADVTVTLGTEMVTQVVVNPGTVQTIKLPWVKDISQNLTVERSVQEPDSAYHLVSTQPVIVYQFSPLQFQKTGVTCANPDFLGECNSSTNDASILLPSTALQGDYIVVSRGTQVLWDKQTQPRSPPRATPGFFTLVGTQDNTTVTVNYSAYTGYGESLDAKSPGDTETYVVGAGEVLQIISKPDLPKTWDPQNPDPLCNQIVDDDQGTYCETKPDHDLTGTQIHADKPVAVFGGHSCSFVPFDTWACDHLEEEMFPLDTWGKEALGVQTPQPPGVTGEVNYWRVISGVDGNKITFDPPSVHADVTLDTGKWIEFSVAGAFHVVGTGRLQLAQYMVGQYYTGIFASVGDPSLGLVPPTEQFRTSYDFLTPDTYTDNDLSIVGLQGATFTLDGNSDSIGFNQPIGSTNYGYEYVPLDPGPHHVESDKPFGIVVSGEAAFTSYLFAGGLNLLELAPQ